MHVPVCVCIWVLGIKFLIITLYIFNYFLFTCAFCASIILVCPFFKVFIFSFIYFFGKRSVSWFPQRDAVEYCTVNEDDKRPMTRTHTPASSTLQYATELTLRLFAGRESPSPTPQQRGRHNTRHVGVCVRAHSGGKSLIVCTIQVSVNWRISELYYMSITK